MKTRIIHECDSFNRSLIFWKGNLADIPPGSKGNGYYTALGADYAGLVEKGATQKPISVSAKNALVLTLEGNLDNMAITAEAVAQDVPGFADLFRRPAHLNPGEVLRTANSYLAQLEPLASDDAATAAAKTARAQVFIDHGVAATFVADLQGQVDGIGTAVETHEESREGGVSSTKAITDLMLDGQKQRIYLNVIALNLYGNQPEKLAAWKSASHVEQGPHHAATPAPSPATATAK